MSTQSERSTPVDQHEERLVRRLQVTGRGSYIVSLPKEWIEEIGLKKGAELEFRRQQDQLVMMALGRDKPHLEASRCAITVSNDTHADSLARKIISLYLVGFSTIDITSKTGTLTGVIRHSIRDVVRRKLVGTEVVTESPRSATLQVLLSSPQLWVPDALRRMSTIAGFMHHDAVQALTNSDKELAKQVLNIDDEVDRFSLYIVRQLKWAVQHPSLVERVGLKTPIECLGYRMITRSVERSADHAARVAQNSLTLQAPPSSALIKDINALSELSHKMMEDSLQGLFKEDFQLAESVISQKEQISGLEDTLVERLLKQRILASDLSGLRLISESLRRIGEYATDVAEIVLNLTVRRSVEQKIAA